MSGEFVTSACTWLLHEWCQEHPDAACMCSCHDAEDDQQPA